MLDRRECRSLEMADLSVRFGFPLRKRDEHGDLLPVAAILISENRDEIALFKRKTDQDVARVHDGKQQVAKRHGRRCPEGEQKAQIDWMSHPPVERWRLELRWRKQLASKTRVHLLKP